MNILSNITFHLCDLDQAIVEAWKLYFDGLPNFKFYCCDILSIPLENDAYDTDDDTDDNMVTKYNTINAIVSPANSFGDLQGGIDLVYYKKFGYVLEEKIQKMIIKQKFGELVIGDALIIPIGGGYNYDYLISAPTMRVPMDIRNTVNVYLAFRAVLIELIKFNSQTGYSKYNIKHVVCPGLGTGIGKISAEMCAKQMLQAYSVMINPNFDLELARLSCEHCVMIDDQPEDVFQMD